jgi:hypothetical protein
LKHARPLNKFSGEKGEYICPKTKTVQSKLKIRNI